MGWQLTCIYIVIICLRKKWKFIKMGPGDIFVLRTRPGSRYPHPFFFWHLSGKCMPGTIGTYFKLSILTAFTNNYTFPIILTFEPGPTYMWVVFIQTRLLWALPPPPKWLLQRDYQSKLHYISKFSAREIHEWLNKRERLTMCLPPNTLQPHFSLLVENVQLLFHQKMWWKHIKRQWWKFCYFSFIFSIEKLSCSLCL